MVFIFRWDQVDPKLNDLIRGKIGDEVRFHLLKRNLKDSPQLKKEKRVRIVYIL